MMRVGVSSQSSLSLSQSNILQGSSQHKATNELSMGGPASVRPFTSDIS